MSTEINKEQILEKHSPSMSILFLDDVGRAYREKILSAMEEYTSQWKLKYDELKAENNSLLVKLARAMQENDLYKDALKDIAMQNKSNEWEDEGDTEYGYNCIIEVARKALQSWNQGNEVLGKEGEV